MAVQQEAALATYARAAVSPDWRWIGLGVLLGIVLVGALVGLVEQQPPRPDVAVLIGGLTFVLTGVLLGHQSPGETVAEAAVSGAIVGLLGILYLSIGRGYEIGLGILAAGWVGTVVLSVLGGWIGEVLQGTLHPEEAERGFTSWPWVGVGTVLGVVLNGYAVFVIRALFHPPGWVILVALLGSFFVAGLFVGSFSPGITILEPAFAALFTVVVDAVLLLILFQVPFPPLWLVIGCATGFTTALAGGWTGEKIQRMTESRRGVAPA